MTVEQVESIKVVVVDDHAVARRGLEQILQAAGGFELVGTSDGRDVLNVVSDSGPDVIIIDVGLQDESGLAVTSRLLAFDPDLAVLLITASEDPSLYRAALTVGALGFVRKTESEQVIAEAVRSVSRREPFLRSAPVPKRDTRSGGPLDALSDRELEVFKLYTAGNSGKQIAEQLGCAVKTAETHMVRIRTKLGVADRRELTRLALEFGLLSRTSGAP